MLTFFLQSTINTVDVSQRYIYYSYMTNIKKNIITNKFTLKGRDGLKIKRNHHFSVQMFMLYALLKADNVIQKCSGQFCLWMNTHGILNVFKMSSFQRWSQKLYCILTAKEIDYKASLVTKDRNWISPATWNKRVKQISFYFGISVIQMIIHVCVSLKKWMVNLKN